MRIPDDDGLDGPELSMAPLIDVVFLLLIFFMVATTYGRVEKQLEVELPSATSGAPAATTPEEIVIDVLRDGRTFVAGREVGAGDLVAALTDAARGRVATPVTVRGDRLTAHQDVVHVLDACGVVGLSNLALGTLDAPVGAR